MTKRTRKTYSRVKRWRILKFAKNLRTRKKNRPWLSRPPSIMKRSLRSLIWTSLYVGLQLKPIHNPQFLSNPLLKNEFLSIALCTIFRQPCLRRSGGHGGSCNRILAARKDITKSKEPTDDRDLNWIRTENISKTAPWIWTKGSPWYLRASGVRSPADPTRTPMSPMFATWRLFSLF